ncbi:hypothetical protein SK30_27625, partial [Bacillus cereus]
KIRKQVDPSKRRRTPHRLVKGNLITPDQTDVYTFDVTVPKEVDISVINEQNIGTTWVLYHESDM